MSKHGQAVLATVYDATGRKWRAVRSIQPLGQDNQPTGQHQIETTTYLGGVEWKQAGGEPTRLHAVNASAHGRTAFTVDEATGETRSRLEYYHTDHLGNVRLAFSDLDGNGTITVGDIYAPDNEVVMEQHYYPFGLSQNGPWFATVHPDNAYRYNGKELDEAVGMYDYGARYYDPAIARWGQVDPLAEEYAPYSPYNYVMGNPVRLIDPDGKAPEDHIFYIAVQKSTSNSIDINAISSNVQRMLDINGINLQVQVLYVGDSGFEGDYKSMLDDTDALTFIGSEEFVENIYGRGNIDGGYNDERVGYVNVTEMGIVLNNSEFENVHYARAAIHEGVGHQFGGSGHPDESRAPGHRYKKHYGVDQQNIMTSGNNTKFSSNPYSNGGAMFLPVDLKLIKNSIPNSKVVLDIYGVHFEPISPKDNFSKRVKY